MLMCAMLGAFTVMCGKCFLCVFLGHSQPLPRGEAPPLCPALKLYFPKDPEGVQHFPGGRGVRMLISIDHLTCDIPGGPGPPIPPLDLHMPLASG